MEVKHEYIKIEDKSVIKIIANFDIFDDCTMSAKGADILATTFGSIKNNFVSINRFQKIVELYAKPTSVDITFEFDVTTKGEMVKTIYQINGNDIKNIIKPPVIFTANKGYDFFIKRISSNLMSDINVKLSADENDLLVKISGKNKNILVCLGEDSCELKVNDLVFSINTECSEVRIPLEFVINRYGDNEIFLHVLVKPDYQKKIQNIFYKSKLSNGIRITRKMARKSINDFSDPVGRKLDPFLWLMDYDYNLPVLLEDLNSA